MKLILPHVPGISQEIIIIREAVYFIKQIYLYHDHYMINDFITIMKIYLYHDHYMIGILATQVQTIDSKNLNYQKSAKTFHRKAVRFKN